MPHFTSMFYLMELLTRDCAIAPLDVLVALYELKHQNNGNVKIFWNHLVYKRYNITNDIFAFDKPRGFNTVWLSVKNGNNKPIYISANYVRPNNKSKAEKFYKRLCSDVNKYKSECSELFVVGDFNARLI